MTSKDLEAELEREPFSPLRLHLVSGKTVRITLPNAAFLLQNAVMVVRGKKAGKAVVDGYDVIALRNIERIETRRDSTETESALKARAARSR